MSASTEVDVAGEVAELREELRRLRVELSEVVRTRRLVVEDEGGTARFEVRPTRESTNVEVMFTAFDEDGVPHEHPDDE